MIRQKLTIFSQNVRKNKFLTDIILENNKNMTDIIFIQEPSPKGQNSNKEQFLWPEFEGEEIEVQ